MRWAHILHGWPPANKGGVGLYVEALAKAQVKRGMDVSIIAPQIGSRTGIKSHFGPFGKAYITLSKGPRSWTETWKVTNKKTTTELLKRINADAIQVHHLDGIGLEIWDHAPLKSRRLISLHDYAIPCARGQLYTKEKGICSGPSLIKCSNCLGFELQHNPATDVANRLLNRMPRIRSIAKSTMQRIQAPVPESRMLQRLEAAQRTLNGADVLLSPSVDLRNRLSRMGYGMAKHVQLPLLRRMKTKTPPPISPLRVLFASGIIYSKGLHVVIDAVESLPKEDVCLTVAGYGEGTYAEEMKKRVQNNSNMNWFGPVNHDRMGELIGNHHVLALPSLWPENAPIVVREALSLNRYVICSSEGGAKEFGENLCLVAPNSTDDVIHHLKQIMNRTTQLPTGIRNPTMEEHIDALIEIVDQVIVKRS